MALAVITRSSGLAGSKPSDACSFGSDYARRELDVSLDDLLAELVAAGAP